MTKTAECCQWLLPWPPVTTNHLYDSNRWGGKRLNAKARAWREEVIVQLRQSGQRLPDGRLAATLYLRCPALKFPRLKAPDVDNVKLILDSVFAAFDDDDNRIVDLRVLRDVGGERPGVGVRLEPCKWTGLETLKGEADAGD